MNESFDARLATPSQLGCRHRIAVLVPAFLTRRRDHHRSSACRNLLQTGLVPRLPTAILSGGLLIIGILSCLAGLILDTVTTMRHEMKRLTYLSIPLVSRDD